MTKVKLGILLDNLDARIMEQALRLLLKSVEAQERADTKASESAYKRTKDRTTNLIDRLEKVASDSD